MCYRSLEAFNDLYSLPRVDHRPILRLLQIRSQTRETAHKRLSFHF